MKLNLANYYVDLIKYISFKNSRKIKKYKKGAGCVLLRFSQLR